MTVELGMWVIVRPGGRVMEIEVRVLNRKVVHGHKKYLITPVTGKGELWVDSRRVRAVEVVIKEKGPPVVVDSQGEYRRWVRGG